MPIVKQRYGTAVSAEVLEESVSEATRKVLSERGLRPAQQPKVDLVTENPVALTSDLEFTLALELLPDIVMPDFGTIELTRFKAEVAPDQDLFASGLVSSMFAMQLVVHLEEDYDIAIIGPELKLDNFRTVQAMTGLVLRLRDASGDASGDVGDV